MINSPLDRKITAVTRTLALLEEEASRLRGELTDLQRLLIAETQASNPAQSAQLLEANEQLVLAALHSDHVAETAVSELFGVVSSSQRDALTNTPNRALVLARMEQAIGVAQRCGTRFAVLFIDLNNFKEINDSYGHMIGDEVLRFVARQLEAAARDTDTVSRFGGDEFLVLLTEISQASDAAPVAAKMLAAIRAPNHIKADTLDLSASIGISVYPDDGLDTVTLIRLADEAMYRAKRHVGGGFEHAQPLPLPSKPPPA